MHDLGTLGGPDSYGYGINSNGHVVGEAEIKPNGAAHAFLYSDGTMHDLGTLGGEVSTGRGVSGSGEVVGLSTAGWGGLWRAFLYSGGTMYDLNSLVVSGLDGATLMEATGINDRGQIVANTCTHTQNGCTAFRLDPVSGPVAVLPLPVVEFWNASLNHYFITWRSSEIAILDAGTQIRGWTRTGHAFKTYATAQAGTSPVCRYYIPPGLGDSHFFGRGKAECDATGKKNPNFVLEDPAFMQMFLPTAGVCPANTTQVYRVFSNRTDVNHRYMTDRSVRDRMVTYGWLAEGDGPDLVVMCAPQ
jgi:probable HAF family extracellular repeat protein